MTDRKGKEVETWYEPCANLMVRESLTLREAAQECQMALTIEQAENHFRRKAFQKTLWLARNRFYKELATDPNRTKQSLVGMMWLAAQKLAEQGEWDKAAEALRKLAQVEGYVGPEGQVNVFGQLTGKDLEEIRKRLKTANETKHRNSTKGTGETFVPAGSVART